MISNEYCSSRIREVSISHACLFPSLSWMFAVARKFCRKSEQGESPLGLAVVWEGFQEDTGASLK